MCIWINREESPPPPLPPPPNEPANPGSHKNTIRLTEHGWFTNPNFIERHQTPPTPPPVAFLAFGSA